MPEYLVQVHRLFRRLTVGKTPKNVVQGPHGCHEESNGRTAHRSEKHERNLEGDFRLGHSPLGRPYPAVQLADAVALLGSLGADANAFAVSALVF
jgi:hypothetical protein